MKKYNYNSHYKGNKLIATIKTPENGQVLNFNKFPDEFIMCAGDKFKDFAIKDRLHIDDPGKVTFQAAFALIQFEGKEGYYHIEEECHSMLYEIIQMRKAIEELNQLEGNNFKMIYVDTFDVQIVKDKEPTVNSNGYRVAYLEIKLKRAE